MSDATKGKRSISLLPHDKYECPQKLLLLHKSVQLSEKQASLFTFYTLNLICVMCLTFFLETEMYNRCTTLVFNQDKNSVS